MLCRCLTARPLSRFSILLLAAVLAACAGRRPTSSPADLGSAASLIRMGDNLRANGDLAGAAEFYRGASLKGPADPAPLVRLGDLRRVEGDNAQAEAAYRVALASAPQDAGARAGLAATLLRQGRGADALALLEPLAQNSPDAQTLCNLGVALDMVGRQADAQATYRRGLAAAPANADLHGNLAFSLAISGDTEAALQSMQTAAALPSGQAWQPANLVLLLAMAGREDTARMRAQAAGMPTETFAALLGQGRRARDAATPGGRAAALGVATGAQAPSRPEEAALPAGAPESGTAARPARLRALPPVPVAALPRSRPLQADPLP